MIGPKPERSPFAVSVCGRGCERALHWTPLDRGGRLFDSERILPLDANEARAMIENLGRIASCRT